MPTINKPIVAFRPYVDSRNKAIAHTIEATPKRMVIVFIKAGGPEDTKGLVTPVSKR